MKLSFCLLNLLNNCFFFLSCLHFSCCGHKKIAENNCWICNEVNKNNSIIKMEWLAITLKLGYFYNVFSCVWQFVGTNNVIFLNNRFACWVCYLIGENLLDGFEIDCLQLVFVCIGIFWGKFIYQFHHSNWKEQSLI